MKESSMLDNDVFIKHLSKEALSLFAKDSNIRFFKHDVQKGVFSFDRNSLEYMNLPLSQTEISEEHLVRLWGKDVFDEYIKGIHHNFDIENYSYSLIVNGRENGQSLSSKVLTVLSVNEKRELISVEVITIVLDVECEYTMKESPFRKDDFRNILNKISSFIFIVDEDLNLIDYNLVGQEFFGLSADDREKSFPLDSYFSCDKEILLNIFDTGEPFIGYRYKFLDRDLIQRNYLFNITRIENVGNSSNLLFSGVDISHCIELEASLMAHESKFQSFFEQCPVGLNVFDNNMNLLDANPAALGILGMDSIDEIKGKPMFDCPSLDKEEQSLIEKGEILRVSKILDFEEFRKNFNVKTTCQGTKNLDLMISKIYSQDRKEDVGYIEILNDKSGEIEAFKQLKKKDEYLSIATRVGNIGFFEIDLVNRTFVANKETAEIFEDSLLTETSSLDDFLSRIHPNDLKNLMEKTISIREGKSDEFSLEVRIKIGDDGWKWMQTAVSIHEYKPEEGIIKIVGVNLDIDRLKTAENKALEREKFLRLTLGVGKIGLWEYDVKKDEIQLGMYLSVTLNLGYSSFDDGSLSIKEFYSIIHDSDRAMVEEAHNELLIGKDNSSSIEFRLNHLYSYQWVRMTVFVNKRDENGHALKMNGFVVNIHEKTVALEESKRVQYLLENSLKIANVGYYYKYSDDKEVDISDTCCDIYKMDREDLSNLELFYRERVHPKDLNRYKKFVEAFRQDYSKSLKKINYRIIIDGEVRMLSEYAKLYFDENNNRKGTLYAVQDVTELYENEARLNDLLNTQRYLSEISIMMMKDIPSHELVDGLLSSVRTMMKARAVSFFKKEEDSYNLKSFNCEYNCSFIQGASSFNASEIDCLEKMMIRNNPVLLKSSEACDIKSVKINEVLFQEFCSSLFIPISVNNEYYGFLLIHIDLKIAKISYKDISVMNSYIHIINLAFEKLHSQAELVKAKDKAEESDRLKSAFLRNMSHEIRTPLNSIVGFSDIIAEKARDESDELVLYSQILSRNTEQLLNIVSNVIDYSEIESGALSLYFKSTNISDVCKEVYSRCLDNIEGDVSLEYKVPDDDIVIETDSVRLKQVLLNLVSNALKFTPKGRVVFGFKPEPDRLVFYVKDSGIGIKSECKDFIYDGFYQADKVSNGVGLGLSISKAIIDMFNGEIWFESNENEGSKFFFSIPKRI
jgi:PAS domain S-box-containing protein